MIRQAKICWPVFLSVCLLLSSLGLAGAAAAAEPGIAASSAPSSLLANGGFEEPVAGATIPGWTLTTQGTAVVQVTDSKGKDSTHSLRLEMNTGRAELHSDPAAVQAGAEYKLSTYVMTQTGHLSGLYVYMYDAQGALIKGTNATGGAVDYTAFLRVDRVTSLDGQWRLGELALTAPAGAATAKVSLIVANNNAANWTRFNLDDIALTPVPDDDGDTIPIPPTATKVDDVDGEQLGAPAAVSPFYNVEWTADTAWTAGERGKVDLRFYDSRDQILSTVSTFVYGELNSWGDTRVVASAPRNAAYVRSAMYIPGNDTAGRFYADNISLTVTPTPGYISNLGPQSETLTMMTAAYGKYKDGRDVMYTVVQGDPGVFAVMDLNTEQVLETHPLVALDGTSVTAAWAITVATDGKAYAGSTPNGTLFQYDPVTSSITTLGKPVDTETVIWTLVPGKDGKVYGGTGYSQTLFEYDPATNVMQKLVSLKNVTKDYHVRSLAYDPDDHVLYAGGADIAKLYRYDLTSKSVTELTIPEFDGKTSVYDLRFAGGKLFVRVDAGPQMFVYDPATGTWPVKGNSEYNARGFSPASDDNRVFYTAPVPKGDGTTQIKLFEYNLNTDIYRALDDTDVKSVAVSYGYVVLEDAEFPGQTLVGLAGNNGRAFYYNLATGKIKTSELDLPAQFAEIHSIGKSFDGRMLTAGFISGGGLGIYSPTRNETERQLLIGQIEGYASLNGKMYFGVYPGATLFEYDPSQPWNRTDSSRPNNPLRLLQIGYDQDRPIAMVGVEEVNQVFIGTFPKAGKTGGALTILDPVTRTIEVKHQIVPDHSLNTMLHRDGKLYIGTGAQNGTDGRLVVYDIATAQLEDEGIVPVAGKKALSSLIWGPDGNIWGMALGTLFIYDPETRQVIYRGDKFPNADYSYGNAHLHVGTDQNIYGTFYVGYVADKTYTSKMFKIDALTKEMTILYESGVEKLAQDDFGNFYFKSGSILMKYSDPALVVGLVGASLTASSSEPMKIGQTRTTRLTGQLDKGRSTLELSGAGKVYSSSNPAVAKIDGQGVITALGAGTAELSVAVTLDGVTVQSNTVTVTVQPNESGPSYGSGSPLTETIKTTVEFGDAAGAGGTVAISLDISRTKQADGGYKDELKLDAAKAKEIVEQLKKVDTRTAAIILPDTEGKVAEWNLVIGAEAAALLAQEQVDLALLGSHIRIVIEGEALIGRTEEVKFRILPLKSDAVRGQIEQRAQSDADIVKAGDNGDIQAAGRPVTIETNLQNRPVTLTLPLDSGVPANDRDLEQWGAYIEHSDGSKELVRGSIVDLDGKGAQGVQFTVNRFSTFAPVKVSGWAVKPAEPQWPAAVAAYIDGYEDGTFRPERTLTRAEMAAIMARIAGEDLSAAATALAPASFSDVPAGHWAQAYIGYVARMKWMTGYADGSFEPDQAITRAEMAHVLAALLFEGSSNGGTAGEFSDLDGHWARDTIAKLQAAGIVNGYEDGSFRPDQPLTRAEAVVMINRLLSIPPAEAGRQLWQDVPADHWAYGAVQSASARS